MQLEKIVELARAIIYAAATGTIVHVSGTNLAHIDTQDPTDFSLDLQFAIVASAILFIVMDGIARYCVRSDTSAEGEGQFFIPGIRFIVEILGLFAFSYWVGLLLSENDPFSSAGYIFLFCFSASCLLNNLLDVLVFTRSEHPSGKVSIGHAIRVYGRVLIWGDIAETNIGKRFASIRRARERICDHVVTPSRPVLTGNGSRDIWSSLVTNLRDLWLIVFTIGRRGAFWRVVAQVGILHGIWFHFLAMALSGLLVVFPVTSIFEAQVRDLPGFRWLSLEPTMPGSLWAAGLMVALAFIAYVWTSIEEQSRKQMAKARRSKSTVPPQAPNAGVGERATQMVGNTLLLLFSVYVFFWVPIIALYSAYAVLMVGAIISTMAGVRNTQPEPTSA